VFFVCATIVLSCRLIWSDTSWHYVADVIEACDRIDELGFNATLRLGLDVAEQSLPLPLLERKELQDQLGPCSPPHLYKVIFVAHTSITLGLGAVERSTA
jgi:hypothetical protein